MADISNLLGSFSLWLFKRITFSMVPRTLNVNIEAQGAILPLKIGKMRVFKILIFSVFILVM
jgi:hypothetical protein